MEEKQSSILKKRILIIVFGTIIGVLGGFLYYKYYGCTNGCPINSNPYLSMIWGGLLGYLLTDLILDRFIKKEEQEKKNES